MPPAGAAALILAEVLDWLGSEIAETDRNRLEPMGAGSFLERILHSSGRTFLERTDSPGAIRQCVQADVGGDAMKPGAKRGASVEATHGSQGTDEGFLHGVVGINC